ncbi:MAG: hypothetical protein H0X31_07410 [Nostocaceae cyanobacterium]|nr:hypothetical protein [Nostocaceae cyanobacterium]
MAGFDLRTRTRAIAIASTSVLAIPLPIYLQSILMLLIYAIILTVFSGGRIPLMLIRVGKRLQKVNE